MGSLIDLALKNNATTQKPIYKDLNTVKNVKPARPKGHLVNTPIYMAPIEYCQDLAKDTYGIVKGWKGEANDHEIGKQNDVAMKLGSLAIAGYLMTFRKAKLPKIMEFIGFGSFFASMALWPKLAISLPIKLRTGVDIQQKYVDSYGRKKDFFQDPQYLAWDLFRKDKIQKMGRKMHIPMDVPNRDEVIQEKARKLAVQGNTLWMATAGFATPIMSGLICNSLEPVVETAKQKYDLAHTQKVINGQTWFNASMAAPKKASQAFERFLTENMGRKIDVDDKLVSLFSWSTAEVSPTLRASLKEDLTKVFEDGKVLDEKTAKELKKTFNTLSSYFKKEEQLVKWVGARCANSADSMSSYSWKKFTKAAFSAIGVEGKDLAILESQGSKSTKLLVKKLEALAKDPEKYKKAVEKIGTVIAEFSKVNSEEARESYFEFVDNLCDNAQSAFKKSGFTKTAEIIGGRETSVNGSIRNLKKVNYDARVLGEYGSFHRFLQTMDIFKRINDGTFQGEYEQIVANIGKQFRPSYKRVEEGAVNALLSSGAGAYNDKFGFVNMPNTFKSIMRLIHGALPDDYLNEVMINSSTSVKDRKSIIQAVFDGTTEDVYKEAVKAGGNKIRLNARRTGMSEDTIEALYSASTKFNKKTGANIDLVENTKTFMKTFIQKVVNFNNGLVKNMTLEDQTDIKGFIDKLVDAKSPELKQTLVGLSPEKLIRKGAGELSNTRKWTKTFGTIGAVLFIGTAISTLFFGHIPTKEMYMKDGNKK